MGPAGIDGHTIRMMGRPGRTVPTLMHIAVDENTQTMDQVVIAVYLNNRWYDLTSIMNIVEESAEAEEEKPLGSILENELIQDLLSGITENIFDVSSAEELLDLFTYNIKGGEINEIPSVGLENIVLPEPSAESSSGLPSDY